MNRSNSLPLAFATVLSAAVCLAGCKKQEDVPPMATEPAASAAMGADTASSVSGVGATGAMTAPPAAAPMESSSGAMAPASAPSS